MLLMKADTARVYNFGIKKFGTTYTDYELSHYIGKTVGIKWDIDDVTKLYVFDEEGRKICEAVSPELLAFGPHCSQALLERHLRDQKRQEREMREILDSMTRPYELRGEEGAFLRAGHHWCQQFSGNARCFRRACGRTRGPETSVRFRMLRLQLPRAHAQHVHRRGIRRRRPAVHRNARKTLLHP